MPTDYGNTIEAFLVDPAFTDHSKAINGFLVDEAGKVAALTPKALSYFSQPAAFSDKRTPSSRITNWFPETSPSMVVDENVYSGFVNAVNALTTPMSNGYFKLVDKLLFNYDPDVSKADLEQSLLDDVDIASIYVPGSFVLSATIVEGDIYYLSGTVDTVEVPSFATFSISLPSGSGTTDYVITLFTSVEAWLTGYDVSTIVKVVPPLPYERIYNASLVNTIDNVFSTAALTATLSYNTTHALLGSVTVSGITEYNAVLVDEAGNTASIPFNILYKGRSPTLSEIREAIRNELLNSGVGTEEGWEARIPGVFVAGRFYIVPYWDETFTKPDQVLFPSILGYTTLGTKVNKILESTAFGDIRSHADIFPVYYNRMTMAAVPDLTGVVDIQHLSAVVPDYQSYAPDEENFSYMAEMTRTFALQLNQILAIDVGALPPGIFTPITENLLTFYSFVVGKYEMCVITKLCYETIMESTQ